MMHISYIFVYYSLNKRWHAKYFVSCIAHASYSFILASDVILACA